METFLPGTGALGWGAWWEAGTPHFSEMGTCAMEISLPFLNHHTVSVGSVWSTSLSLLLVYMWLLYILGYKSSIQLLFRWL